MSVIKNIYEGFSDQSRIEKYVQFIDFTNPSEENKILDAGVSNTESHDNENFFDRYYKFKNRLTCLGKGNMDKFRKRYKKVNTVSYDGNIFPFSDNEFDYSFSNAVVEHVGGFEKQVFFISELVRVTKNRIMFTTPNKSFPLELHTKTMFIHWFNNEKRDNIYAKIGKKWATNDYMNLLNKKDIMLMMYLINQKHNISYKIKNNKMFGLTATFTIFIEKQQ